MEPLRVAIIGGGPGAMFVCHAWDKQKREAEQKNQKLPHELQITCFEREPSPGGIWRVIPDQSTDTVAGPCAAAYDELWTNGSSHSFEFYDYTFDEHFDGIPIPVYLPRKDVTEYLMQRVTKDAPTFFDDYFQFQTEVLYVKEAKTQDIQANFQITVRNVVTGVISEQFFDKCIWAAGENSQSYIPETLRALFTTGQTAQAPPEEKKVQISIKDGMTLESENSVSSPPGKSSLDHDSVFLRPVHSTETKTIRDAIESKGARSARVLLIGGGFSAEDLALQCLKWGAGHVHVAARDGDGEVNWATQWPGHRVAVYPNYGVRSVGIDPNFGSSIIQLEHVRVVWPHAYEPDVTDGHKNKVVTLRNIDIVVFCTGYKTNLSMLDESLVPAGGIIPQYHGKLHPTMMLHSDPAFQWGAWTMSEDQAAHKYTGDVPAAQGRMVRANYNHPDLHRGIFLKNPNMMFLCEHGCEIPLLSLDVHAWLFCSYLTGRIPMPSISELKEASRRQVLDQMHLPCIRYTMDEEYARILDQLPEPVGEDDCGYWPKSPDAEECGSWDADTEYAEYMFRLLARVMQEGQYPGKSLGKYEQLSEAGKKLVHFENIIYYMRTNLEENVEEDDDEDAVEWRTYRDGVDEPKSIHSIYTGTPARPLKKRWMDAVGPMQSVKNGI